MKNVVMIIALLMLTATSMFAQGKKTPEQRADAYAEKAQKDLGLTPEQKSKVRELALTRAKKMDELRAKYKGKDTDKQVWRDERKKVRDEFHAGVKAILSPEQLVKWEEQRKKQAEKKDAKKDKGGKGKGKGKGGKGKTDSAKPNTANPAPTDDKDGDDPELDGE